MIDPIKYPCEGCKGLGGFDASRDCEVYDEWIECESCDGSGEVSDE